MFGIALHSGFMAPKEMWPYEEFKGKYAKPIKRKGFPEALEEVEENPSVVHVAEPEALPKVGRLLIFHSVNREC